jgi:alkylation response protein AidB-like acyl-CoA dehydrogenase
LGAGIEERFGGTGADTIAPLIITANLAGAGSITLTLGCHLGIGMLPIVYFGSTSQKEKYLPGLTSGNKIGAYALTEPLSGSDALSMKSKAVLSDDGKFYVLNGEKQFITNGGFADVIITYARVDDKVTAFIVERDFEGVSTGPEEKKMGIRGSSTTSVVFEDAKIPVENLLFESGKGHVVALNILNVGRLKLAGACAEGAKMCIELAVKYAKDRQQFGKPICQFGLIKHKLAEMATRTYIADSMFWRTGGQVDGILAMVDMTAEDSGRQCANGIAEYATECAMNKVFCSELLDFVADEAVQIHGGYGFIEEYPVERVYRDNRINRIFEGTNEINRLTTMDWIIRKALKNEIPLFDEAKKLSNELLTIEPAFPSLEDGPLEYQRKLVEMAKKVFLMTAGAAAQKYGLELADEQEILGFLSDIAIEIYAMESGLLRAQKAVETVGEMESSVKIDMVQVYVNDAMKRIDDYGSQILAAMEDGDVLHIQLSALKKLSSIVPINTIEARRRIADRVIEAENYAC